MTLRVSHSLVCEIYFCHLAIYDVHLTSQFFRFLQRSPFHQEGMVQRAGAFELRHLGANFDPLQ